MTLAILDGDVIAFRAAAAAHTQIEWEAGEHTTHDDAHGAAQAALQTVQAWMRLAKCSEVVVAFTGRLNFRKSILPTYKANRAGKAKPQAFKHVVNQITERFPTHLVEGLEADDLCGILGTRAKYDGAVMCSIDKDFRCIPGRHLNPMKQDRPDTVSLFEADYTWLMQAMTGDATDGYSGLPKVGPKKAAAILGGTKLPAEALWPKVTEAAALLGIKLPAMLQQARVARILRDGEYNKDERSVRLWTPKGAEEQWLKLEDCK